MIQLKRLHSFVLGSFLPLMLATYSVCLFILLMLFLWQFVNDMVGKGVGIDILGELFFYACVAFTPTALPLAILLASLITFGNLGEHLELLAMKASGISLLSIMKPLIVLVSGIAIVSFFFQADIAPKARAKMYTIVLSLRQKSPELEIPEGTFYKDIPQRNVYVRQKDKNGLLRDIMIYDYSSGFENTEIIVADSGRISTSTDKNFLALTLHNGESFRNWGKSRTRSANETAPYMRESFRLRNVLIPIDMQFTMADEAIMGSRDINKNLRDINTYIDSVRKELDSIHTLTAAPFKANVYASAFIQQTNTHNPQTLTNIDSLTHQSLDERFQNLPIDQQIHYLRQARRRVDQLESNYSFSLYRQGESAKQLLSHIVQYGQRWAIALSCILFFFIGAPLGAIIRKGGLGMPVVLSVFLYLSYYLIDNFSTKMARQAVWTVWEGVWLGSAFLGSLGALFTVKAVNDSVMIDPDSWRVFLTRWLGKRENRHYQPKEVVMTPPDYRRDLQLIEQWNKQSANLLSHFTSHPLSITILHSPRADARLNRLITDLETLIDDLLNASEAILIAKLMDYPLIRPLNLRLFNHPILRWSLLILFPIGLIVYGIIAWQRRQIYIDLATAQKVNNELLIELQAILTPNPQ